MAHRYCENWFQKMLVRGLTVAHRDRENWFQYGRVLVAHRYRSNWHQKMLVRGLTPAEKRHKKRADPEGPTQFGKMLCERRFCQPIGNLDKVEITRAFRCFHPFDESIESIA